MYKRTVRYFVVVLLITLCGSIFGKYVRELTNGNFKNVVTKEKMILVNFYVNWCPPCRHLKPTYNKAANTLHGIYPAIPIAQIDCARRGRETCRQHHIRGYPTITLFKNGRAKEEYNGDRTEASIVAFIKERALQDIDACKTCRCQDKKMDCRMLSLTSVPQNIPSDIENVDLSCNRITNIKESAFIHNPNIRILNLGRNKIKELPSNVFKSLSKLKRLHLYNNQLSAIDPGTFSRTFYLETLLLSNNLLQTLPNKVFDMLLGLQYLSLQGNRIRSLPSKLFNNQILLRRLQLYNNGLSTLPKGIFDRLASLQYLALHGNKLSKLQKGLFDGLTSLQRLTLHNNNIITMDDKLLGELKALKWLDMGNNRVSSLPTGFLSLLRAEKIIRIKLSNNPLICSCQLYQEIEPLKSKIWGTCDRDVEISSIEKQPQCW